MPFVFQCFIKCNTQYPQLSHWVFDFPLIASISTKCKHDFLLAIQLFIKHKNRLLDIVLEVNKCL